MTPEDFARRRLGFCTHRTRDECRKTSAPCPVVANDWSRCAGYRQRSKDNVTSVPLWVLRGLLEHINR